MMCRIQALAFLLLTFRLTVFTSGLSSGENSCKSRIFCDGEVLKTVQMSHMFPDSKTFVDMPTKFNEDTVVRNFHALGSNFTQDELVKFVNENFHPVGHDVITVEPNDWIENPPLLAKIADKNLADFAHVLNGKWKNLIRQFDPSRICADCSTTAIYTDRPFVVPGGRFIEYYYWDSFWVVDGLLSCDMIETARNIIENFIDIVRKNGFVPNGARIYYLNRSQPPLLTQMVDIYYEKTKDLDFLNNVLPYLDKEYEWWMTKKYKNYTSAKSGKVHKLNWYNVQSNLPRPESFSEDYVNANMSGNITWYYANVYSAAESGWDFSSRWFNDPNDIKTIAISQILPIDLNSILLKNEKHLEQFHRLIGTPESLAKANEYLNAFNKRMEAFNDVFWTDEHKTWTDFNLIFNKYHNTIQYPTDFTPLWAGVSMPSSSSLNAMLKSYNDLLFSHVSGVPSSNLNTHEQWDLPNVWAPYHSWLVEILMKDESTKAKAVDIAQRFVNTVYCGWKKSTYIYEKYNSDKLGAYGQGGEYVVQEGFGWTNGVAIKFMEIFGDQLKAPTINECEKSDSTRSMFVQLSLFKYHFMLFVLAMLVVRH